VDSNKIFKDKLNNFMKDNYPNSKIVLEMRSVSLNIPVTKVKTKTLKNKLIQTFTGGVIKSKKGNSFINALNNINCKVYEGDRVALIGHNGAGKTTFLRLISGIYSHTSGELFKSIKIYPIIEKSFITSLELNGLTAIKAHYLQINNSLEGFEDFCEEIVDFTGLGEFLKLPIKTYSEGMKARLQFALTTSGKHESIALDEGFATGDKNFKISAQERLDSFLDNTGTFFFASHSDELLKRFCKKGFVFQKGSISFKGNINDALDFYYESK
tara:strand:+ start:181 stop:990 length:810 start_codon:yes stop_codon:yes gene_type:complete